MSVKVTVLGAGTLVPTKKRNPAGFLVQAGRYKILLDAGFGIIRRLVDLGFRLQGIDLVFVSHFHTDHFADVFPLIHSRWVEDTYRKTDKHKALTVLGPQGLKKRWKLWRQIYWVEPEEHYPVKFYESSRTLKLEKLKMEIFPVTHVRWFKSVGIRLDYAGKKIVYTGDIGSKHPFERLVKVCRGADLLVAEASYEHPTPNHYTVEQVKELAEQAKVKKVLVVHVRPQHLKRVKQICTKEPKFIFAEEKKTYKV